MKTRQAASIARIRAARRGAGLCLWCGDPSPERTVCRRCRPAPTGAGGARPGAGRPRKK